MFFAALNTASAGEWCYCFAPRDRLYCVWTDFGCWISLPCWLVQYETNPEMASQLWKVDEIVRGLVKIKVESVVDALPVNLIGMCNYIKFCADHLLLVTLGSRRHAAITKWEFHIWRMEMISLHGKTIFFENRVGAFLTPTLRRWVDHADQSFALDAARESI